MNTRFSLPAPSLLLRAGVLAAFVVLSFLGSPKVMMPAAACVGPALFAWFVRNHPVKQVLGWGIPTL